MKILLLVFGLFLFHSIGFSQMMDSISIIYSDEVDAFFHTSASIALKQEVILKEQKKKQIGEIELKGVRTACKLRLKGDWTDHVRKNRWSFRIEMEENPIHGLHVFSLQFPETRGGLNEYFFQQTLSEEGIQSTDYRFVHLTVNGEDWGIVAMEGHPSQLKSGLALKFNEEGFWECQHQRLLDGEDKCYEYPIFEAASIEPFGKSKIYADEKLKEDFLIGRAILESWQKRIPKWESLNLSKFAKYYALCDVFQMYHGLQWHNQRFLYKEGKIEPIAFDCFGKKNGVIGKQYLGLFDDHYATLYFNEQWFNYQLFTNEDFKAYYSEALTKYCSLDWSFEPSFEFPGQATSKEIENRLKVRCKELQELMKVDQLTPSFFSYEEWKRANPEDIHQYKTPFTDRPFKHVSIKARKLLSDRILIKNYHLDTITILGVGTKEEILNKMESLIVAPSTSIYCQSTEFKYLYFRGKDGDVQRIRIEIGRTRENKWTNE